MWKHLAGRSKTVYSLVGVGFVIAITLLLIPSSLFINPQSVYAATNARQSHASITAPPPTLCSGDQQQWQRIGSPSNTQNNETITVTLYELVDQTIVGLPCHKFYAHIDADKHWWGTGGDIIVEAPVNCQEENATCGLAQTFLTGPVWPTSASATTAIFSNDTS